MNLSRRIGLDIDAMIEDGKVYFFGYDDHGELVDVDVDRIGRGMVREAVRNLRRELLKKNILGVYERVKALTGTVVYGVVQRQVYGNLHVAIQGIPDNEVVGICDRASQPPRERGKYRKALYPFYVLSVRPVMEREESVPVLEIRLSRNSTGLVECLLRQEMRSRGVDVTSRCEERIAGAISEVRVSGRVPRDGIKAVSDRLQERIRVIF